MIEQGTRFIGFSPRVDLSERKTANSNSETEPYTIDDIRGYKLFSAIITQSNGDDPMNINEGMLQKGVTYTVIGTGDGNEDFSNVGLPILYDGAIFIATESADPINWDGAVLQYNAGAPVANIIENTIGNVWFRYEEKSHYTIVSDSLFTAEKTLLNTYNPYYIPYAPERFTKIYTDYNDEGHIALNSKIVDSSNSILDEIDGLINNFLIEIRVYA